MSQNDTEREPGRTGSAGGGLLPGAELPAAGAGEAEAIVESAPVAMLVVDASGRISRVNAEAEHLFGYPREELLGSPVDRLVPDASRDGHAALLDGYFADPHPRFMGTERELQARRRDGSEVSVEIGLLPLPAPQGLRVLATIADVSRRVQLAEKLRARSRELEQQAAELAHSRQALEQSNLDLQQFAYLASHDLQTPLRSVSGFAQLLEQHYAGRLDDRADDWIRRVVAGVERMQTLINDLLAYSRVESRARPFARISMQDVYDDALAQLASSILDAEAEVTRDALPEVTGDRTQLVQLLQNLIGNAIKYQGDAPPRIHVGAERSEHGDGWTFSVRDNGIGIDPRHREKVFEIFRRLHTVSEYPGTGIGLAVCRRVVLRHGGGIWCDDAPGGGSIFRFTIPDGKSTDAA